MVESTISPDAPATDAREVLAGCLALIALEPKAGAGDTLKGLTAR